MDDNSNDKQEPIRRRRTTSVPSRDSNKSRRELPSLPSCSTLEVPSPLVGNRRCQSVVNYDRKFIVRSPSPTNNDASPSSSSVPLQERRLLTSSTSSSICKKNRQCNSSVSSNELSITSNRIHVHHHRIRSFSIKSGQMTNDKADVCKNSFSISTPSNSTFDLTRVRVLLLGSTQVGKTCLAQQLITSESLINSFENSTTFSNNEDSDDDLTSSVSVMLNGKEFELEFIDEKDLIVESNRIYKERIRGILVVFSITDKNSFSKAAQIMESLKTNHIDIPVILVANKIDLVRKRVVGQRDAKLLAKIYMCKYTEVSALLAVKVDELLVGLIGQINRHEKIQKANCCQALAWYFLVKVKRKFNVSMENLAV